MKIVGNINDYEFVKEQSSASDTFNERSPEPQGVFGQAKNVPE